MVSLPFALRTGVTSTAPVTVVETTDEGCELLVRVKEVVEDALNLVADDVAVGRMPGLTEELADLAEVDRDRDPWGMR